MEKKKKISNKQNKRVCSHSLISFHTTQTILSHKMIITCYTRTKVAGATLKRHSILHFEKNLHKVHKFSYSG